MLCRNETLPEMVPGPVLSEPLFMATNVSQNATARSWWNRAIEVKCRCRSGCKLSIWFYLNQDIDDHCGKTQEHPYGADDKGELCWRGWFALENSNKYVALTGVADSNYKYTIVYDWDRGSDIVKTFSHGWWSSKRVVGSGGRCQKVY